MARVTLIRPAEGVSVASIDSVTPTLPLGLAYIAASVRDAGHTVQVIDAVGEAIERIERRGEIEAHWIGLPNAEVIDRIDPEVEVIGVGNMFSHNWPMVRELLRSIRERFPDVPIMTGGENATSMTDTILTASPADFCVLGEGEETVVELLAALGSGAPTDSIHGLAFRAADGTVVRTPRRNRIRSIDEVPNPAWDLFDVRAYAERNFSSGIQIGEARPVVPILATRGCPYLCTFCTSPNMWTTAYVTRDPKLVVDEIESYVRDYGARNFPFQDLTAITKRTWIIDFCNEIIRRDLKISWQMPSGTRSEAVDDEVAPLLRRSGMVFMGYAPESGSDRIRELIKKRVKAPAFYKSVRSAMDAGLHVQSFFIMGFEEEKVSDLFHTLRMISKLAWMGVPDVAVTHYMPYPGSEMYDRLIANGKVDLSDKWLLAPLQIHGLVIGESHRVNDNYSALTQSVFYIAGYALFYSISMVRKPVFFAKMVIGMFTNPSHDVTRLQKALKKIIGTKSRYRRKSAET